MGLWQSYRLRVKRQTARLRAARKRRQLLPVADRTGNIRPGDILLFSTIRNEAVRLPYFLQYYRDLGVGHFLIVDNDSDDGSREMLAGQPDLSLWTTRASYGKARFGVDWLNGLQSRHGHDHWCLTVDADEFLVYPFCDTRPLRALTDWLDASEIRAFSAMLLDMYPKGPLAEAQYRPGQNPFSVACWFDAGNYAYQRNNRYWNLWIQGGPRARAFFADQPEKAPALNKIPLVRWQRRYAYISSTHALLPRGLNLVYDTGGGEKASGCLMHAKFLNTFGERAREESRRGQHYAEGCEYSTYARKIEESPDLWSIWSEKYINWRQLEILGLMSKGNWA